jgi:phospholipid/cholesterol/gamma-HCH transport system substrate-binding protein
MTTSDQGPGAGRLRRTIDRIKNEPGLGRNVLVLGLLIVGAIAVLGYLLGEQGVKAPWNHKFVFYATFHEAPAIAPGKGQEVRVAGVPIGDVEGASIAQNGNARLELSIDESKYDQPIYQNAVVTLRPQSPLNHMYVELNPGSAKAPKLHEDDVLSIRHTKAPVEVDEALGHLNKNTRSGLAAMLNAADVALVNAPKDLPPGLHQADKVVKNLQPVVAQLNTRRAKVKKLITQVSEISTTVGHNDTRLASLADTLQTTLGALSQQRDALQDSLNDLPGFVHHVKTGTGSVQQLSAQLNPTLDDLRKASRTLPDSLSKLTGTINQLSTTVDKARPVAKKLGPVANDLKPFVGDFNESLTDLRPITTQLDPITKGVVPYLPDLAAFAYNSDSLLSLSDANGGILRGLLQFGPSTLPIKGLDKLGPTQH